MDLPEAAIGFNPMGLHTFPMSFTGTSARTSAALKPGGYTLRATQDCWIKLGDGTVTAAAISATSTPPSSPNDTVKLFANTDYPLTIPASSYLAVIRASADGELLITGPWQAQP